MTRRAIRSAVEPLRRRVRLRTRLRRLRDARRRFFPRQLPPWSEPPTGREGRVPGRAGPATGRVDPAGGPSRPATSRVGQVVVVDPAAASPRGRQRYEPAAPTGTLRLVTEPAGTVRWEVYGERVCVVAGQVGEPLGERRSAVLAQLSAITCPPAPAAPAGAWAELVAQLAVTGTVLHLPDAAGAEPGGLAPELVGLLAEPLPPRRTDPMRWEIRSVRQRRVAMRHHSAGLAAPPAVSALLVTKRPRLLPAALAALASQTYPALEVVVGVHGSPVPVLADLPEIGRPLTMLAVPAHQPLGEALAATAAAASGRIVTKVDDDDRYGPEHIWDLVLARHHSRATVVGKGAEFVYLEPKNITVRRRMAAETTTDTVAGGTIALAGEDLAGLGGWPPVPRAVDRALLDRVVAAGGTVYRTHPLGFVYTRHGEGHTWDPGLRYFLRDPVRKWRGLPPYPEFGAGAAGVAQRSGAGTG